VAQPVTAAQRLAVARRAHFRYEYCLLHEDDAIQSHHVDHIISGKHLGGSDLGNLAYACNYCNWMKGSDIATFDSERRMLIPLFKPRIDRWQEHFGVQFGEIVPLTPVGEATVRLLQLNAPRRVTERKWLAARGRYPGL